MALIIGGKQSATNPVIATIVQVQEGLYDLIDEANDNTYNQVENRGVIVFGVGDKVLVLFNADGTPYIEDIGTVTPGYNFIEIATVTATDDKAVIVDHQGAPNVIRTNSSQIEITGVTSRSIQRNTPFPTVHVNGEHVPADSMTIRTIDGLGTNYIDFSHVVTLTEGDKVYEIVVQSDNNSTQVSDQLSVLRNTVGPNVESVELFYPGTQSAVKLEDSVRFVVHTELETSSVCVKSGAFTKDAQLARVETIGSTAVWIGTTTIGNKASGTYDFLIHATDDLGNLTARTSSALQANGIVVDQLSPSIHVMGITYPAGQFALKKGQQCSIEHIASDFTSVTYQGESFRINEPTDYSTSKLIEARNSTPDGEVVVVIVAHRAANDSSARTEARILVDNHIPTVIALTIQRDGEEVPKTAPALSAGTHLVKLLTNTALKEPPALNATIGVLGNIRGQDAQWEADLEIAPGIEGEGHFHNFHLRGRSNILGGGCIADTGYHVLDAAPIIKNITINTPGYGEVVFHNAEAVITVTIDALGTYRNDNIVVTLNAAALGGPSEVLLDTLIGHDTLQGSFLAEVEQDIIGAIGTLSIQDVTGRVTTCACGPINLWAMYLDYFEERNALVKGTGRTGWLQLLNQPHYFSTLAYYDAAVQECARDRDSSDTQAIIHQGTISVPPNALANTTYVFYSKGIELTTALHRDFFVYVDGWSPQETEVYPTVVDLSSYSLAVNESQIAIYVNGNGLDRWAPVSSFSRDVPPLRLRTQVDLQAMNAFLGSASLYTKIFFRIELKTDASCRAPRVANFGVCYYGVMYRD